MSEPTPWRARRTRLLNRFHARLALLARAQGGFRTDPEPRTIGTPSRGQQLCEGHFLFAGVLVEAPETSIWDLPTASARFEDALHGFAWLDDLAAEGTPRARRKAQAWMQEWVARFGRGRGPGWSPDVTGRRLLRWVAHSGFLLHGEGRTMAPRFHRSLAQQARFLSRRWVAASPGLGRVEALVGLIHAGLTMEGKTRLVSPAVKALGREARKLVDAEAGVASRNPEELLDIFALLTWASSSLSEARRSSNPDIDGAIARIAPTLRALRHADGGLARFHGGGRGAEGRLDQALAFSGVRGGPSDGMAMGYVRLSHGRTTVIADAAAPPETQASADGHASTLAFELTSGRRPVIVNCGSGKTFGPKWRRAGRATASHSTLAIEGYSSSRLGTGRIGGSESELLVDAPRDVRIERRDTDLSNGIIGGHDGYLRTHGLTHVRQLHLSIDGRTLQGEDVLATVERTDEKAFDAALDRDNLAGLPFKVRFHLHPDVDAALDVGGAAVSLALRSGEVWVFRHHGSATLTLEPSVYLETGRLAPRATQQIVLSSTATEYATRVSWTLAKALETPNAVRDLQRSDDMEPA
ncbi:heparinase II/III family protein [Tranquillimonas rosea]|uniref:heparinase II/III family protein n=1 Tax=Tranquillimonas rosea TaxID=641238 RepID=UPI003BA99347